MPTPSAYSAMARGAEPTEAELATALGLAIFRPVSFETSRGGLAVCAPKREYLKWVANGDGISYSASTPSMAPSPCALVVVSAERSRSCAPSKSASSPSHDCPMRPWGATGSFSTSYSGARAMSRSTLPLFRLANGNDAWVALISQPPARTTSLRPADVTDTPATTYGWESETTMD